MTTTDYALDRKESRRNDRDQVARIAARIEPIAFNPALNWHTPSLLKVRRRVRFRALRTAIEIIRMVRSPLREGGEC